MSFYDFLKNIIRNKTNLNSKKDVSFMVVIITATRKHSNLLNLHYFLNRVGRRQRSGKP